MNKKGDISAIKIIMGFIVGFVLLGIIAYFIFLIVETVNESGLVGDCDCATGENCDALSCEKCPNCEWQAMDLSCFCPEAP